MSKLVKQRRESIQSFTEGGRPELAAIEQEECSFIMTYLPEQMSDDDIKKIVLDAIAKVGALTLKDMGKVVAFIRPTLQGKADMSSVSNIIKCHLSKV